jgi:hypothetical protein
MAADPATIDWKKVPAATVPLFYRDAFAVGVAPLVSGVVRLLLVGARAAGTAF